jgi:drug/metabolite transporter (DMT)-like permease
MERRFDVDLNQQDDDAARMGLLLALSVIWGGSFFFTGVAVKELPPFTIVVLRVGLAALILHFVVRATGQRMPGGSRIWAAFFGMGVLNNVVPFCLIVWGQTQIASGLASILIATTPLFAVIVAPLLTIDEKMTGNRLAGVLVGFAGVVLMFGPAVLSGLGGPRIAAQLAVVGAALSYALAGIYGRQFKAMGVAPIATATGQVTASTVILIPVTLLIDRPWMLPMPASDMGRDSRHRGTFHRSRLHPLLPHFGDCWRHQSHASDILDPSERHSAWVPCFGRASAT